MTTQTLNGTSRPITYAAGGDWRDYANCQTIDPDTFFPTGDNHTARKQAQDAKTVCGNCFVRAQCLDWAVETRQYAGIWGGQTEDERRALYETPEQSFTRCLNAQEWIEEQMALGAYRRDLARQLGVDPGVLGRAVKHFALERAALDAAADAIDAAEAVNAA